MTFTRQENRSPTGTGVSARLAMLYTKGEIEINQPMIFESIIGSQFTGKVVDTASCGHVDAVITSIEGSAHITGRHEFFIDPEDPFLYGFTIS